MGLGSNVLCLWLWKIRGISLGISALVLIGRGGAGCIDENSEIDVEEQ
jgi:hypothetical protein